MEQNEQKERDLRILRELESEAKARQWHIGSPAMEFKRILQDALELRRQNKPQGLCPWLQVDPIAFKIQKMKADHPDLDLIDMIGLVHVAGVEISLAFGWRSIHDPSTVILPLPEYLYLWDEAAHLFSVAKESILSLLDMLAGKGFKQHIPDEMLIEYPELTEKNLRQACASHCVSEMNTMNIEAAKLLLLESIATEFTRPGRPRAH